MNKRTLTPHHNRHFKVIYERTKAKAIHNRFHSEEYNDHHIKGVTINKQVAKHFFENTKNNKEEYKTYNDYEIIELNTLMHSKKLNTKQNTITKFEQQTTLMTYKNKDRIRLKNNIRINCNTMDCIERTKAYSVNDPRILPQIKKSKTSIAQRKPESKKYVFKNSNIVSNNPVKRNKEYILSSTNILTGNACNYRTADASTQIIKNPVLLNPTKPLHSIKIHTDFQYLQNLLKIENIGPLIKVLPTNKHINSYRESQLHGSLSPLKEFIELQKNEIQHNIDEDNKEDSIVLNSAKSKEQKIAITNYILMKSSNKYKVFFTII